MIESTNSTNSEQIYFNSNKIEQFRISNPFYYIGTCLSGNSIYDRYFYLNANPISYSKNNLGGTAFYFELVSEHTMGTEAYFKLKAWLDQINLKLRIQDIHRSLLFISVIDNIVVFTIENANLSNPILLEEKETQKLEESCLRNYWHKRRELFFKINLSENKINNIPIIGQKYHNSSANYDLLNYTYLISGNQLIQENRNLSVCSIAYSKFLNIFYDSKRKENFKNKFNIIPRDKLLNIKDFFKPPIQNIKDILDDYYLNEIALFNNKFIIYSSINYDKLTFKLSNYDILK